MTPLTKASSTHESHVLYNLAQAKINNNKYEEALGHLREALAIAPDNPDYLSTYGYCLAKERESYDKALELCRRALKIKPADPDLLVNLGRVLRLSGDFHAAHEMFLRAWEKQKGHSGAAAELCRMGVRRPPVFTFLPRSHWCNKYVGKIRAKIERLRYGKIVG
ncbi:MAG: tetratricopeptide repeat protein [Candidatus Latescibacteria bacterium]|nr:tetratricopeptide repeat protein [Candidatus Latescibacterota bacterium]NIM22516.1 tetratricopeptide repeat protein [Candidatus Latescibacterota bacterium]NIM64830.1 tetratricopeptide repeat protein [Candidatus Latescibacterota bacterium]NIO01338.1 tetratricopeptide repeat protein [Candidatus Latescibacterota bacterium]NIO27827.1 tetratricopeptide repeat protein [Candidatus Latescibacterota bacterium]